MASHTDTMQLFGDKKIPFFKMVKRLLKYLKNEIWRFVLAMLLIVVNVCLDIVLPLLISEVTRSLSNENIVNTTFIYILLIALGYLGLTVINQFFLYIESMILQKAGQRIVYALRKEVFEHIENMSINQLNLMPVGSLVTRVATYTARLSNLFTNTLVNLIRNILTIVGVYCVMLFISLPLALLMLVFVAVVFVVSFIFGHVVRKLFNIENGTFSDMNTFLNENISSMKLIQIFNQERGKEKEFKVKNDAIMKAHYHVVIAFALYRPFISMLQILASGVTFYAGIEFALIGAEIVAFYLYIHRLFQPVQNLADQLNEIQRAMSASERLFNLLDVEPEVLDKENALDIDTFEGKIEFRNVWFAYEEENWILKDVSFVVNPKETVALVGATGSGKTTILSLLVRNYEPQKGQILIDDIDIRDIKISSLRKGIGQMLQDVFLFSGTIKSNVTLYDESFSDEEVKAALNYVNATKFIDSLEHGINEEVKERGENFSSGQRQLLSFARTVLFKPQILFLDEATANIDTETEVLIQDSLEKMKTIGTMLVVAHRLSTIQHANNIICLQDGKIIESGTHQELLKKKGYYYKLYLLQFS